MERKIRLLYHGDSPNVTTGFGIVAKQILLRLYSTERYDITCIGVNHFGQPHNLPFQIWPASTANTSRDIFGLDMLEDVLRGLVTRLLGYSSDFDVFFSLSDIWTLELLDGIIKKLNYDIPWVSYFPIDGEPIYKQWLKTLRKTTVPVCYSKYAFNLLNKLDPFLNVQYIPHGVDSKTFAPLSMTERRKWKKSFGLGNNFVIGIVGRNQPRKNLGFAIRVFDMIYHGYKVCGNCFRYYSLKYTNCPLCGSGNIDTINSNGIEDSILYLHCDPNDNYGVPLINLIDFYDLHECTAFPSKDSYSTAHGVGEENLNRLYNCFDVHFLPTLGEGFGLPIIESMSCGIPNIVTRTSAVTELVEGCGELINPIDLVTLSQDHGIIRPLPSLEQSVKAILKLYEAYELRQEYSIASRQKALEYSWDKAAEEFDNIFNLLVGD